MTSAKSWPSFAYLPLESLVTNIFILIASVNNFAFFGQEAGVAPAGKKY